MKLHRICVLNLNSLQGEHTIDLDRDLESASLFLIHGPTGSGKSTIMDAVSLALFGSTPRLHEVRAGRDVAAQVMSRETGEARAEVEFSKLEAGSRVRYQAAWLARRAHGRADGTMKEPQRSLTRLGPSGPEELVSDHRGKVYAPVFEKVLEGFSQVDFQRSMLLAQGSFDAMLRASPADRAAILERLTDTGIYKTLGHRASTMWSAWNARVTVLKDRVRQSSLDGEEGDLSAAGRDVEQATGELARSEQRLEAARHGHRWVKEEEQISGEVRQCQGRMEELQGEEDEVAPDLEKLNEHRQCATRAFPLLDKVLDLEKRTRRLAGGLQEQEDALPRLRKTMQDAEEHKVAVATSYDRAREAWRSLQGPAGAAEVTGERVENARREHQAATSSVEGVAAELEQGTVRLEELRAAERAAGEALEKALARTQEREVDAPLLDALGSLNNRGAELATMGRARESNRRSMKRGEEELEARRSRLEEERRAHEEASRENLEPLQAAFSTSEAALHDITGKMSFSEAEKRLEDERDRNYRHQEGIKDALRALEAFAERRQEEEQRLGRLMELQQEREAAEGDLHLQDMALGELTGRLQGLEEGLDPLKRSAALAEERSALRDDEPCPLCGSSHHPYVDDPRQRVQEDALQDELRRAEEKLGEARQELEEGREATNRRKEQLSLCMSRLEDARVELGKVEEAVRGSLSNVEQKLAFASLDQASSIMDVEQAGQEAKAREQETHRRREALKQARAAFENARAALDDEIRRLERRDRELEGETRAVQEAEAGLEKTRESIAKEARRLEAARGSLRGALGEHGILAGSPEEGLEEARRRVGELEKARSEHREARDADVNARKDAARAQEAVDAARKSLHDATGEQERRWRALENAGKAASEAMNALRQTWAECLVAQAPTSEDAPSTDDSPAHILAWQDARVATLEKGLEEARELVGRAERDLRSAQVRAQELGKELAGSQAELAEVSPRLATELEALGLPGREDLLARRLPEVEVKSLEELRSSLKESRVRVETSLQEATRRLDRHREGRPEELPPDATLETVAAALEAAEEEQEGATDTLSQARGRLLAMERRHAEHEGAKAALEEGEARAGVWKQLHDCIGIREGTAFQLFAQALNLGQLLTNANRHLKSLKPRYHLQVIKDPDKNVPTLDFEVVDSWQAGETRSLKTLSGGESFLVSLALALGLSDLRTSSMPVETLMLDEGFGTLDPQALDTALSALQALQSHGRQVGIISHVAALQESIQARLVVEPIGEGKSRVRPVLGSG